jgi:hypothetical protein
MRIGPRLLFCAVALALACGAQAFLPSALIGRWISDDPRYAGHSLTLSPSVLTFEGAQSREVFTVRGVETLVGTDGSTLYTVRYGAEGADDMELRLRLAAGSPAKLQLGDRPERWHLAPRDWGMQ